MVTIWAAHETCSHKCITTAIYTFQLPRLNKGKQQHCTCNQLINIQQFSYSHPAYISYKWLTYLSLFAHIASTLHTLMLFSLRSKKLAACDSATVRLMKINWTFLSLFFLDLHSNLMLPSTCSIVTLHTVQIFPECYCSKCTKVEAAKSTKLSKTLNGIHARGSLQDADIGIFVEYSQSFRFGKCFCL